jgi:diguanylate cyclase (GGDEF)-like protein
MYIDLDNFKPVNDRLGHEAGDHVLKSIAQRLLGTIRKTDFAARIGGDEFVVVLENIEKRADIETVAQGILKSLKSPIAFEGHACGVGASIGIAVYPDDAEDRDALTRAADEVMYRVKQSGRNDYRFA